MHVLIHDLDTARFGRLLAGLQKNIKIISDTGKIKSCIGCFGCWVKTPGQCVIKDGYEGLGALLAAARQVTVISKCTFGGYSPFIKNVIDRSISYLLPFFKTTSGRTHHQARYAQKFSLRVLFYGKDIGEEERETARALVGANSINFLTASHTVSFFDTPEQLVSEGGLQ